MKTKDLFETTECSRCGGCGHYSWNALDGDRCYGCGGKGYVLTKAGSAARDAWIAGYTRTKLVEEIRLGDAVMVKDYMRGREVYRVVTESKADELNPGQNRWHLRFDASDGGLGGIGTFVGSEIRLPASREQKDEAYRAIAHMPGALRESLA